MSYQPVRAARHEERTFRGLRHRLTWWGEPSAQPVVLLHGFMDCGDTWQFLVDCLPDTQTFVAPDWRGFGGSQWVPGGYWFPDYLADLEAMLESFSPGEPARVIAHSMGANVATLYAGIRPRRLRWLVNLEGVGLPRTQPEQAPDRYAQWLDEVGQPVRDGRYSSVEQFASVLRQRNPRLCAERALFVARAWTRRRDGGSGEVELAFDPRHRFVNPVLYRLEEALACWSRVEIPVLMLAGAASEHLQRRVRDLPQAKLQQVFRNLHLATLPGVGHMMHYEDPAAVAREISEFERSCA